MMYLKTSVGIEIRNEDLIISCLKSNFSRGVFTHFKRIPAYRTRNVEEVRKEIERYFKSQRLSRESIVLGIPRGDAIIRHLDLPREVEDNLKQVVLYQVQSFEPTEEEKFYFDYAATGAGQPGKRLQVLLVMVRKSVLDAHLEALGALGIRPATVSLGSVALANLFLHKRTDTGGKTFLLADLKPGSFEILALRDSFLIFTREAVREEAKAWKEILLQELELAAGKIRLSPDDTIEKIVLAGEESEIALNELRESIEECELIGSTLPVEMPVRNRAHLQEAATSVGLAFSGLVRQPMLALNLLPSEQRLQRTRWAYVPTVLLSLIVLFLLAGLGLRQTIQERILGRKLDQEINALKGRVNRVQAIRAQAEALEKKILFVEGLIRQTDMNLEILQELTTILPPDTFLNAYRNAECTIQINGSSTSLDLIPKLERSPLLKNVQQRGTTFKDAQTGKERFTYEAKCER